MDNLQKQTKVISCLPSKLQSPNDAELENNNDFRPILHLQTAFYQTKIDDIQRRVERLKDRNQKVEQLCGYIIDDCKSKSSEAERAFSKINNAIAAEIKKMNDRKQKIADTEKERSKHAKDHFEIVKELTDTFESRRIDLYSQIKELNAKINTLEDFKAADAALREKYDCKKESMAEEERKLQSTLADLEYKAKTHKENLKREANRKILEVSSSFQVELKRAVPESVQRIMRENVILRGELYQLRNDHRDMVDGIYAHKNHAIDYQRRTREDRINTRRHVLTTKVQRLLLEKLSASYGTAREELSKSFVAAEGYERDYVELMQYLGSPASDEKHLRRRRLEVLFHREMVDLKFANVLRSKTSSALATLSKTLSALKSYAFNTAVPAGRSSVEDLKFEGPSLESFVYYLSDIIKNYDAGESLAEYESVETVADASTAYSIGDLGFEPKRVKIYEGGEVDKARSATPGGHLVPLDELLEQEESGSLARSHSESSGSISTLLSSGTTTSGKKPSMDYLDKKLEGMSSGMSETEEHESNYNKYENYLDYAQD